MVWQKIITSFNIILLCFITNSTLAVIRYVKPVPSGLGNGTSWANASSDLQLMINNSAANDEIWVAAGTYYPSRRADAFTGPATPGNRLNAFVLKPLVNIYGGFAGTETLLSERNILTNKTILSGDINIFNNFSDNCFHVIISTSPAPHRLDGFHIQKANANGTGSFTVYGVTVNISSGGAVFLENSSVTIANCTISGSYSLVNGGAVCNHNSNSTFINCVFSGNMSEQLGGAIHFDGTANPVMHNCTVAGNHTASGEGAIHNTGAIGGPDLYNTIVTANQATGGGIQGGLVTAVNCNVQMGYTGTNITSMDPNFVAPVSPGAAPTNFGDYRLSMCSPLIDAGDQALIPAGITEDLDSKPRITYNNVDLGAYEYLNPAVYAVPDASGIVYVNHNKNGNGSSWANAVKELADALLAAKYNNAIQQIWVAQGGYKPKYHVGGSGFCSDPNSRNNAFVLVKNVKLYGGFTGNETLLSQRNWISNITTLTGDLGTIGTVTDNSYHVLVSAGDVGTAELNGFTITGGYANAGNTNWVNGYAMSNVTGAGIFCKSSSPIITNCNVANNSSTSNGGGMIITDASPIVTYCNFNSNATLAGSGEGGAIYCSGLSSLQVKHTVFTNNIANGGGSGGGISTFNITSLLVDSCQFRNNQSANGAAIHLEVGTADVDISNAVFSGNDATNLGGAICSHLASTITNCLFSGNESGTGGSAIHFASGAAQSIVSNATIAGNSGPNTVLITSGNVAINNSIIYGNEGIVFSGLPVVSNSLIEGGFAGTGNINVNPGFISPVSFTLAPTTTGDYHLNSCSQAINAGNNSLITPGFTTDLEGNNRIIGGTVDMGAYEVQTVPVYAVPSVSGIVYVDQTKSGNGSSWANAVPQLADALMAAKYNSAITQIWVAKGTYIPKYMAGGAGICTDITNRNNAFVLVNNVKVYGGFAGGETALSQRNIALNETILSGDLNTDNNTANNSYHVVVSAGAVGTAVLDGFTVTKGNANGTVAVTVNGVAIDDFRGGGIALSSSNPTIRNCTIHNNLGSNGGGMSIVTSSPVIEYCKLISNTATVFGGAVDNYFSSSPVFNNSIFTGNRSLAMGGAFVNTAPSTMSLNNCTIAANYAVTSGGALYNPSSATEVFKNCIIWGNQAGNAPTNTLSLVSGSCTATNCIIEGSGFSGTGNITQNPDFISPVAATSAPTMLGDYRISKCSPAVNTGSNALIPVGITTDLDGNPRIVNSTVDMGAYEFQGNSSYATPNGSGIVFVDKTKSGNGSSWASAVTELADALKAAKSNAAIQQIWVAKGTYLPVYDISNLGCTPLDPRDRSFVLVNNVKVYGGFAGTETLLSQRNWITNKTVLSGDIGTVNVSTDNAYHVVVSSGNVGTAVLDGFTITKGYANSSATIPVNGNNITRNSGAGIMIYSSAPLVTNCILTGNTATGDGGGLYVFSASINQFSNCNITNNQAAYGAGIYATTLSLATDFINCAITGNQATANGGGVYAVSSFARFTSCIVSGNTGSSGGGMYIFNSNSLSMTNCLLSGNTASSTGGGLYCSSSGPTIANCTFSGNRSVSSGAGLYFTNLALATPPKIYNSIVYGNRLGVTVNNIVNSGIIVFPDVYYSIVENASGYDDMGNNLTSDPLFINPVSAASAPTISGNYGLQKCSPAINSGNNAYIPGGITTDLVGNNRILNVVVDRGAYESNNATLAVPDAGGIVYVDNTKNGNGSSWANAVSELADALKEAKLNTAIKEIWVAKGTYYPQYDAAALLCSPADNRDKSFVLVNSVKLYGGFAGGESSIAGRDYVLNETILSGDIGVLADNTDNSYHVVIGAGALGTAEINGFSIINGNANVNSTITVNTQTVSRRTGGGIMLYNGSPLVTDCNIRNNNASLNGGGVYFFSNAGTTFTNCSITYNTSPSGAGFYATTIAPVTSLVKCNISNNTATSNGGGVYVVSASLQFYRCVISGNTGSSGAGVYFFNASNNLFNNCLISGNVASGAGGGVWNSNSAPDLYNTTIAGNRSGSSGGGFYYTNFIVGQPSQIYNSIIYGNKTGTTVSNIQTATLSIEPDVYYSIVENATGYDDGGNNLTSNPLFINPLDASASPVAGGNYRLQKCSPAINSGTNSNILAGNDLDNNARIAYVTVDRGAYEKVLALPGTNGIVYVDSSNVTGEGDGSSWDKAVTQLGDALKAAKVNAAIQQIWVAKGTYFPIYNATDNGSLLSCPTVSRDNSFVLVNNVKVYGGFAGGELDTAGRDFVVNETVMSGDFSKNDIITGSGSTLTITNNTENAYNVALSSGPVGTAVLDGFTVLKGNANLSSGRTVNGVTSFRNVGGGLNIAQSSPQLSNIVYSNNSSTSGGGIYVSASSPLISICSFINNISSSGGGGMMIYDNTATINNCSFIGNKAATFSGGGLHLNSSAAQVKNCNFSDNYSFTSGGGVSTGILGALVENCRFTGNTAGRGGGIFSSHATVNNCIFTGNISTAEGGAVYYSNSGSPSLTNCTISGNSAATFGGGIYLLSGTQIINNCIVWGNTAGTSGNGVYPLVGSTAVTDCIIEGGYASGTNIYTLNPLFVAPLPASNAPTNLGDYRLQDCSPAINLGNNAYNATVADVDNNPRIAYVTVDLGAYEKQYVDLANSTWKGVNTNWNDKVNWCGGYIPYDTTNVVIPTGLSNYPVINSGFSNGVKNLLLANNTSIGLSNNGKLSVYGTYTNNGCTINNKGTWVLAGKDVPQSFPGSLATVTAMNILEVANDNSVVLDKPFSITGSLVPTRGNIQVDNVEITLKSSDTATASVDIIQDDASISYNGTGAFIVERYIHTGTAPGQHAKTWQFLATPTTGQTIYQAWQEGGSTPAGFGTWITGTGTGFDATTALPSLKYFNASAVNWAPVTNTADALVNKLGYMLFVRGDRTVNTYNGAPNKTTMRSKGILFSPTNPPPFVTVPANTYQTFGNPYASRVKFSSIHDASTGINDVFYVWDPSLAGSYNVGGYQTISGIAGYIPTVGTPPNGNPASVYYPAGVPSPNIESGQAVFVKGNTTGGQVNFNEQVKVTGSRLVNRPSNANGNLARRQFLFTSLFTVNSIIADGNIIAFEKGFGNDVNDLDAGKIMNAGENFGLMRNGSILAVEAHEPVNETDTLFYNMSNLRRQPYQLRFAPVNMGAVSLQPLLVDRFTRRLTPLSLTDSSFVDFTVTNDAASSAADRFIIVFKVKAKPKITQTEFSFEQGKHNTIHEVNLEQEKMEGSIRIYPNPVIDGNIQLWFKEMPTGMYQVKLINSAGQHMFTKQILHQAEAAKEVIRFNDSMSKAVFRLEITCPDGKKSNHSVIF